MLWRLSEGLLQTSPAMDGKNVERSFGLRTWRNDASPAIDPRHSFDPRPLVAKFLKSSIAVRSSSALGHLGTSKPKIGRFIEVVEAARRDFRPGTVVDRFSVPFILLFTQTLPDHDPLSHSRYASASLATVNLRSFRHRNRPGRIRVSLVILYDSSLLYPASFSNNYMQLGITLHTSPSTDLERVTSWSRIGKILTADYATSRSSTACFGGSRDYH